MLRILYIFMSVYNNRNNSLMNKAKQDFFRKMNHVNHQLPQIVVKKHPVKRRKIEIGKSADNKK